MTDDQITTAEEDFKNFVDPPVSSPLIQQLPNLEPNRCSKCGKLLFKGSIGENGIVEVKCRGCGHVNRFKPNNPPANFQDRLYLNRKRRYGK